jgi:regulator of sigma E protease
VTTGHFLFYVLAFAVALGVLIVVHEFGHYACARSFGVKVLRFSIGFGKPLLVRRFGKDGTEWTLSAFPLGGYVRMLDETEAPVAAEERHRAFNQQSVWRRILIVAAGPVANLLLAVVLYWGLFLHGVQELRPVLGSPPAASAAAQAGVTGGETVRAVSGTTITTWQDLRWEILNRALQQKEIQLDLVDRQGRASVRTLDASHTNLRDLDGDLLQQLGLELYRPQLKPIVGTLASGMPAAEAGMQPGDEILTVAGKKIEYANDVTAAVVGAIDRPLAIEFRRDGMDRVVTVTPRASGENDKRVGRIGITFKDDPATHVDMLILVRYAAAPGLAKAVEQTWQTSVLYLKLVGRMITGQLSWRNLSGPVTIADYAGQSASAGLGPYLSFLALISISLGVLNLLPIPILDGGHLLYYLAEIIRGGPLPDGVAEMGRRIGFALLVLLMVFALYNDINRLFPG